MYVSPVNQYIPNVNGAVTMAILTSSASIRFHSGSVSNHARYGASFLYNQSVMQPPVSTERSSKYTVIPFSGSVLDLVYPRSPPTPLKRVWVSQRSYSHCFFPSHPVFFSSQRNFKNFLGVDLFN